MKVDHGKGDKPQEQNVRFGSITKRELVYQMQMSLLWVIRQKIEALPDNFSKEDVLKVLDECKPGKP